MHIPALGPFRCALWHLDVSVGRYRLLDAKSRLVVDSHLLEELHLSKWNSGMYFELCIGYSSLDCKTDTGTASKCCQEVK